MNQTHRHSHHARTLLAFLLALAVQWPCPSDATEGFGLRIPPAPDPFRAPPWRSADEEFQLPLSPRQSMILFEVDTLATHLSYRAVGLDGTILGTTLLSADDVLMTRATAANSQSLTRNLADGATKAKTVGADHIEIDIPFKVKSKTFRRIFGSGRIGLNVHGNISLRGTYRAEKRDSESASVYDNNQNDFRLEQQQQFTVVGKVGEKVDVHIDQNTERSFDFENNLSIIYTGEPEEVIESISAGNISLNLPSTKYVSFSDRSSGLFGLKMVTRFGPLRLTGIASTEKNESKQQTFTGSSSEREAELGPGDHVTGFFFVNEFYRHQYRVYDNQWRHTARPEMKIMAFDLYTFTLSTTEGTSVQLVDPAGNPVGEAAYRMKKESWDPTKEQSFSLDPDLGILRINTSNTQGKFIAMAYTVTTPSALVSWFAANGQHATTIHTGTLNAERGQPVVVVFPNHFNPDEASQPYWDLQLRNVFRLGTPDMNPAEFAMQIEKTVAGASGQRTQAGTDYLSVLYLDVNDANKLSGRDGRVDERWLDIKTGNVSFPSPRPFGTRPEDYVLVAGGDGSLNSLGPLYVGYQRANNVSESGTGALDKVVAFSDTTLNAFYQLRTNDVAWLDKNQEFRLKSTAQVGTEVISLGWNVTNVTVTANNRRLAEGTDYTLDAQAGLIRIINPTYTTKDQRIQVSYETPQLFQLRKKTFAGMTAELDLWENGAGKSKLGAAYIYFNEETAERKVRLGNEPIKNVVLDLNASLRFEPRLMTTWMDALPLIEADAASSLTFEAEYAMVIPDPNPSNSTSTGDANGVAYVDDFESSKQEIPLSVGHTQWFLSTRPEREVLGLRGWMGWYNPREKVPSREIWPEYQESDREGVSNEVRVLRLEYEPFRLASQDSSGSDTTYVGEVLARNRSWAGLYYDFRNAYDDLSDKKFIELTLLVEGDYSGTLNLDLGMISEDVVPIPDENGRPTINTEDTPGEEDNLLQENEDIGLDRMKGRDPPWPLPDELFAWSGDRAAQLAQFGQRYAMTAEEHTFDWWDLDGDGIRDPAEPWSYDDYVRAETSVSEVDKSHGWEGNSADADQLYPDTEDRNGNLTLDTDNNYFSYQVPLNPADPAYRKFITPKGSSEWVFVRIPLKDSHQSVGSPKLTLVNGVRLWLTGFTNPVRVTLAELNIVGNEWRKSVVADSDTSGYDVAVLNNYDNSDDYESPPGASGQKDLITGVTAREQSLVLEMSNLAFGTTAWARKQMATTINLAEYRELKMFVHGGAGGETDTTEFRLIYGSDKLEYRLRLLSTENDYYEYTKFVRAGWDPANNMRITFSEITGIGQFNGARRGHEEPDKPVRLSDGGQIRVVGNPSITRIRSMLLGITNHGSRSAQTQVWFNELRVSNVKKENSRAMRADMSAKFSDVLSFNTNYERKDADYHTVKERAPREGASFKENYSAGVNTDLGRLLPPSLGLSLKASGNASRTFQVPKFYPNDDQEVDLKNHPRSVENQSDSRSGSLTVAKSKSKSKLAQHTVDKLTLATDLTQTVRRDVNTLADTTLIQNFRVGFADQFKWTHTLKPFAFAKEWPLVKKSAALEIGYFPQGITVSANTARRITHTWRRDLTRTHAETYTLARSWSTSFKPLNTLSLSLQRSYDNNLKFRRHQTRMPELPDVTSPRYPLAVDFANRLSAWREQAENLHDGDQSVRQTANFTWAPKLVTWTSTSFGYNTSYNWTRDLVSPAQGVALSNSGRFSADLKLEPSKLIRKALWMSDANLTSIKKEFNDAKTARKKERQAESDARIKAREAKRAAKDLLKDGPVPALADTLLPSDELAPVEDPEAAPGLREALPQEMPLLPTDAPPLPAVAEIAVPDRDAVAPVAADTLDLAREVMPLLQPLVPLQGDSLLMLLPDSLRRSMAVTDSLIKAAAMPDSLAQAQALPAQEDTTSVKRDSGRALKAAGRVFTGIWKRLGVAASTIEPVDIRFKRDADRTDPGQAILPWTSVTRRHASLGYQLALSQDTGTDTLRITNTVFNTTRGFGYDYTLGTRVNLSKELPVRLAYGYAFSQQFSNESENSRRESETGWYDFENDKLLGGSTLNKDDPIGPNPTLKRVPDFSFSLRKLNRLPLLAKPFKDLNLNFDYKGKADVAFSRGATAMYRSGLNFTRNFSPLAGLDFQLGKGWGGSANYTVTRSLKVNNPDAERSVTLDMKRGWTLSAQKALKGGFKIPVLNKRMKNDTTLRLTYDNSRTTTLNSRVDTASEERLLLWNTPQNRSNWSLALNTDYNFSRNVTGGASWKYGVDRQDTANDRKSYMEFSVNCRVEVRSR